MTGTRPEYCYYTGMSVSGPANLSPPADDISEHIGCRPRVRVVKDGLDLIIRSIIDAESVLEEDVVYPGFEIIHVFGIVLRYMFPQLVGKILAGMGGIA